MDNQQFEDMKARGVTHVRRVAGPDACAGCKMLDGQEYNVGSLVDRIELHAHDGCRCEWVPVYGFEESGLPLPPQSHVPVSHENMTRARFFFSGHAPNERDCYALERSFKPVRLRRDSWLDGEYGGLLPEELFLCVWKMYREGVQILECDWLVSVLDYGITGGLNAYFMARAHRLRGDLYLLQGDDEIALNAYDAALAADPKVGCKKQRDALKKELDDASV